MNKYFNPLTRMITSMKPLCYLLVSFLGLSLMVPAQDHGHVYVENGRLYFPDGEEVALWGVNLQPCISWESSLLENAGVKKDPGVYKKMVDRALDELEVMKCRVLRCHLTPADFTDAKGNLVETIYLDMLDYMIAEAPKHGMYTYITFLNHMGRGEVPESFMFEVMRKSAANGENLGRSDLWLYRQANLMFEDESLACAKNYIRQLITRTNPYNRLRYFEDPTNILWEVMNEPRYMDYGQMRASAYHYQKYQSWLDRNGLKEKNGKHYYRYRKEMVVGYLNDMHDFIRGTGAKQPVSWGCNWHKMIAGREDVFSAIAESKVEAVSFCNYPGQDEAQKNAGGDNYWDSSLDLTRHDFSDWFKEGYTNREWYGWLLEPRFAQKAKLVYEYETFYNQSAYLYPVQAEFMRALGVQVATMWHYSFSEYAPYRSGSHVLNLNCTPRKAASFAVAAGIFEATPLLQEYNLDSPAERVSDDRMYSYRKDLGIFSSDDVYYYSGDVSADEQPKPPGNIREIVGQGSSPVVEYGGNGLYSVNIQDNQVEIFIAPDHEWVSPPWQRGKGLVTRLDESVTHPFELKIGGDDISQGKLFRLENGKWYPGQLKDGRLKFDARPGHYVIDLPSGEGAMVNAYRPLFTVYRAGENMTIDGKMDEACWNRAEARGFDHYYAVESPDEKQKTSFRVLWDDQHLYLLYACEDKFLTSEETRRDGVPYLDDCAEIFIIPVPDRLDTHLGFEINLLKAANDFVYFNGYYHGKDKILKSYNPEIEVAVSLDGTLNDHSDEDRGWTMEMAIPVSLFAELTDFYPLQTGSRWAFQAVRQDRNRLNSTHRSRSTLFPIPGFGNGGVHRVECFGLMEFTK